MKNLKTILIVAFVSLAIISCNKDDDGGSSSSNSMKLGAKNYQLKAGVLENYGEFETGVYNFDVTLVDSEIANVDGEILPTEETFNGIYFELFTSNSNNLDEGVYQFSTSGNANTFEFAGIIVNGSLDEEEEATFYEISSGSFEVLDNGNSYKFEFEGKTTDGQDFSGSYKGSLAKNDYSNELGRGTIKNKRSFFKK